MAEPVEIPLVERVTVNSEDFNASFYGILNAQGEFWTPLAFDSEDKAEQHIRDFWRNPEQAAQCLRTHRIVPVQIQLTAIWAEKP